MKKAIYLVLIVSLAFAFIACSKKSGSNSNNITTPSASQGANNSKTANDNLIDIPKDKIRFGSSLNENAVLAEIPAAIFKGVGTVYSVDVMTDNYSSFKYTVVLKFYVNSSDNAVKALMDYYKSVGAKVEETGNRYNPYSVVFDWGESTEVSFGSPGDGDYVNVQFGVVKK